MKSIPFIDLARQNRPLEGELREAFARVLSGGQFILGQEVERFEEEAAQYLGCRYALGVSSGTDALLMALMALGVGPGDEVITTPFSFFATAEAIARLGAKPVFADIDPRTLNLDPVQARAKVTARTKAFLPVHLFGNPADLEAFCALSAETGIPLVEDCAQSMGATWKGRQTGSFGLLGCFSFYPSKTLPALGDGGLVTTSDETLYKRLLSIRVHGSEGEYHHARLGGTFRLDALQAAFLRVKLPHLDAWNAERKELAALYQGLLPAEAFTFPKSLPGADPVHSVFSLLLRDEARRDRLKTRLAAAGIGSKVFYPLPLHRQPVFTGSLSENGGREYPPSPERTAGTECPFSEEMARRILSLPLFPGLRKEEVIFVAQTLTLFSS